MHICVKLPFFKFVCLPSGNKETVWLFFVFFFWGIGRKRSQPKQERKYGGKKHYALEVRNSIPNHGSSKPPEKARRPAGFSRCPAVWVFFLLLHNSKKKNSCTTYTHIYRKIFECVLQFRTCLCVASCGCACLCSSKPARRSGGNPRRFIVLIMWGLPLKPAPEGLLGRYILA